MLLIVVLPTAVVSLATQHHAARSSLRTHETRESMCEHLISSRRSLLVGGLATLGPLYANAAEPDCMKACMKECSKLAPGAANLKYCKESCRDFCADGGDVNEISRNGVQ